MTDSQWSNLLSVVLGKTVSPTPAGFIIDSPWLPNWFGIRTLDYFTNEDLWFRANLKAIQTFPELIFLPGFWSEFGMCTEPSAFGARSIFPPDAFPFAEKAITDIAEVDSLVAPNPATDGLLPFMLNRLVSTRRLIEQAGHRIRFSVSRGPLNIATFLMGTTEFLVALKTDPGKVHTLLRIITDFLHHWHELQRATFDSIDGIFMLDDIVGFIGEQDFKEFGLPYFRELYSCQVTVKFFHNDAECAKSIRYYPEIGINLYNPGIFNPLGQLREMSGHKLAILGTIPPRDVLAQGSPADVTAAVKQLFAENPDRTRLILSCAGGMPPGVSTENIRAFVQAAAV